MSQPEHTTEVSVAEIRSHLIDFIERTWVFDTVADNFIWVDIDNQDAIAKRIELVRDSRLLINDTLRAIGGLSCSSVAVVGEARHDFTLSRWDGLNTQGKMVWAIEGGQHEFDGPALINDLRAFQA